MTPRFLDEDDMFWRRGHWEDWVPLNRDGWVVLVERVRRSSVSGQLEFGMPVCHQVKSLEFMGLEI